MLEKKWYVVRTYSGHENKVKAYIENEVAQAGLGEKVTSVIVPSEKVFEVKDGKKKSKTRDLLPGVHSSRRSRQDDDALILNTPSVIGFVGPKNAPGAAAGLRVRRLIGKIEETEGRRSRSRFPSSRGCR